MKLKILVLMLMVAGVSAASHAESISATVQTGKLYELGVPLNGVVQSVTVQLGDTVKKGNELLRINCSSYDIKKKIAEAKVDALAVGLGRVRAELDRTLEMYDQDLITEVEMQEAKDRFSEFDAHIREADGELQLARLNQRNCVLHAPVDGSVVSIQTNPGDVVAGYYQPSNLIGLLVNDRPVINALSSVPLEAGRRITIFVDDHRVPGVVSIVEPVPNGFRLLVVPEETDHLSDGQFVTLEY